jgi:hypothetical protein
VEFEKPCLYPMLDTPLIEYSISALVKDVNPEN